MRRSNVRIVTLCAGCLSGFLAGCLADTQPDDPVAAAVVFTYPVDGQRDVPTGARLLVSFSDAIAAEVANGCRVIGPDGPVAIDVTVEGQGQTLTITSDAFVAGTTYDVHAGTAGEGDVGPLLRFTTRSDRPRTGAPTLIALNGSDPLTPGTLRPMFETSTLALVFSEPIDPRAALLAPGAIELVDVAAAAAVPAVIVASGIHVAIDPYEPLTPGALARVASNARSARRAARGVARARLRARAPAGHETVVGAAGFPDTPDAPDTRASENRTDGTRFRTVGRGTTPAVVARRRERRSFAIFFSCPRNRRPPAPTRAFVKRDPMSRWKEGPATLGKDASPLPPVIALRNRETGEELAIGDGKYVIGKSESCDLVLADPCVSRLHCVLERRQGTLYVRDRGSRNGTFVNDRRIECGEITPGVELMIGLTRFVAVGPQVPGVRSGFERLLGRDPAFVAALEQARRVAVTDVSVLVVGETGTGKELVAQAIHETSRRAAYPFVAVNCGAFPRELIGSELFGHERGAFTGASDSHDGVFVQADRGTLFLDELGELPLTQQPHLLRALETRRVRRIGGSTERGFDVRLVAATNNTVGLGTERGALRLDLYHRVATVIVQLPPLRARPADIDPLCDDILDELAAVHGRRLVTSAARRMLREYRWPGNVRELRQTLTRGAALSPDIIGPEHLFHAPIRRVTPAEPPQIPVSSSLPRLAGGTEPPPLPGGPRHDVRYASVVRDAISDAIERHGSMRAAAVALGMPKSTLADKVRRLGLTLPVRKADST